MDIPLQWSINYLKDTLPPDLVIFLGNVSAALLHPSSPVQTLRAAAPTVLAEMGSLLESALDTLTALVGSSPAIVSTVVVVLLAVVVLQLLSIVRRVILFWTRLALSMLFWSAVVLLAAAAWQRGIERSLRDLVVVASRLAGWLVGALAGAADLFWHEYEKAREAQGRPRPQSQMHYQTWRYQGGGAAERWP
ncbi:hypothetical protein VTH82DRAFT_2668 [Thermothelomyces myriococcoides]